MIAITPYTVLLVGIFVVMALLIVRALQYPSASVTAGGVYRRCTRTRELIYLLVLIGFSIGCLAIELLFTDYVVKLVWGTIRFIAFAFLPPAVLQLYLRFTESTRLVDRRSILLLHVVPFLTSCMVLTNPLHHLVWTSRDLLTTPYASFIYNYSGPLFWLHAAYSYILLLSGYGVLLVGTLKKPGIYRGQGYIMLAGAFASLLINAVYIFEIFTDLGDLTMPATFVAAACLYWAIFIHKPDKMIRMARTLVVNELGTPVLIFDNNDKLIDANQNAITVLNIAKDDIFSLSRSGFMERIGYAQAADLDEKEVRLTENFYTVIDKSLADKNGLHVGRYIVFTNVTHIRNVVKKLEFSNTHDRFTGMYNRNVFQAELKKLDQPGHLPIALISLNIYGMKFLNTVFGYEFGDQMIRLAADAVTKLTEGRGICARFSGDEFVIALHNTTEREADEMIRQIKETANHPPVDAGAKKNGNVSGFGAHISLSSGIAVKENRSENIDLVFKNAITRMFRSKLLESKAKSASLFDFLKNVLQNSQYETNGHVERIQALAIKIAEHLNFSPSQCENMRLLSLTHNIGILGTPVDIIKKAGSLSNEEWEEIRLHTVRGYNIAMLFPDLAPIAEDILHHHERYDGLGYPDGLKGEEIPIGAQIIQLLNYFDELTHPMPPDKPLTDYEALEKIKKQAGEMFSPALAEAFMEMMETEVQDTPPITVHDMDDDAMAEILKLLDMDS